MVSTRLGLTPARKVGSAPDNKGLTTYQITSGYGTALGSGEPVALSAGTLVRGVNGSDVIGVVYGIKYVDATNNVKYEKYWPASTVATDIEALVIDDPNATFLIKANAAVTSVVAGELYAVTTTAPSASHGRSTVLANISGGTTALNASMIKVVKVIDTDDRILEVTLANHSLRDDG